MRVGHLCRSHFRWVGMQCVLFSLSSVYRTGEVTIQSNGLGKPHARTPRKPEEGSTNGYAATPGTHTLVGGTNQEPEPKRALWEPNNEPSKEVIVERNLRQDREDAGKELPVGSNRDAYHFLGASALRNTDSTNRVNRDAVTEDYDHISKVAPASIKSTD